MPDLDELRGFLGAAKAARVSNSARRTSVPKTAIIFSTLVLAVGLALAVAGQVRAAPPRQDSPPLPPDSGQPPAGDPAATPVPRLCAECHVEVAAAWETSMHAQAFVDPVFQDYWQKAGSDPACLACHTTGYDPRTGTYAREGVTCEACHGPTPPDHPGQPVMISPGPAVCERCHPTTVAEWQHSAHGAQQIACATCHNPHPHQLRFSDDSVALCLNCHEQPPRNDYVHLTHPEPLCTDCHWFRPKRDDLLAHFVSGALFPTGHTAVVETAACVTCHADRAAEAGTLAALDEAIDALDLSDSPHPLLAAQARIRALEAEIRSARTQGKRTETRRAVQGALVGLVAGSLLTLLIVRARRRRERLPRAQGRKR